MRTQVVRADDLGCAPVDWSTSFMLSEILVPAIVMTLTHTCGNSHGKIANIPEYNGNITGACWCNKEGMRGGAYFLAATHGGPHVGNTRVADLQRKKR
jgi:hypothetical protein